MGSEKALDPKRPPDGAVLDEPPENRGLEAGAGFVLEELLPRSVFVVTEEPPPKRGFVGAVVFVFPKSPVEGADEVVPMFPNKPPVAGVDLAFPPPKRFPPENAPDPPAAAVPVFPNKPPLPLNLLLE